MIELELTYLARSLPTNLKELPSKKIIDRYVAGGSLHSSLRIRMNGDNYELTRKAPVSRGDASTQSETTIVLNRAEFESLSHTKSEVVEKTRYYFAHENKTAEFDVFEGDLSGLVLIDFEFGNEEEKKSFAMPDFCLADVTQEDFVAGGMLAGKSYDDIKEELGRFDYKPL